MAKGSAEEWGGRLLRLPARLQRLKSNRWFFAGVLKRGLRLLRHAEMPENALFLQDSPRPDPANPSR